MYLFTRSLKKIPKYGLVGTLHEAGLRLSIKTYGKSSLVRKLSQSLSSKKRPQKWVFILGCYNSGTTLLQRLLSAHPDIRTLPREGVRFTKELRRPEDLCWTRMWNECMDYMNRDLENDQDTADKIIKDWSPWWRGTGKVFLEKSITNILRAEWLEKHFPNSYFIGITRNGFAASYGIVSKAKPRGAVRKKIGESYPIEMAAKEWVAANNLLQGYPDRLKHYSWIRYEDLIVQPEYTLNYLFKFLGLGECPVIASDRGVKIHQAHFELWNGNTISLKRLRNDQVERIAPIILPLHRRLGYDE